jgi:hypothetical protein
MIIDCNETPGGLASTDVTPEGFVSSLNPNWAKRAEVGESSMMLAATLSSPTTNISTTA